jgi:hypothetical protein
MIKQTAASLVDQIAVAVAGSDVLDDDLADRVADDMVAHDSFRAGPAAYLQAIETALDAGEATVRFATHDAAAFRAFLSRVASTLRKRAPFPEPSLQKLPAHGWAEFSSPVGELDDTRVGVQRRLRQRFESVDDGGTERHVLLLQLRSGEEIALFAPPERADRGIAIRQREPTDAASSLHHFADLSGYPQSALRLSPEAEQPPPAVVNSGTFAAGYALSAPAEPRQAEA